MSASKKKLLVVAGSGASVSFGMPSVKEIDKIFNILASNFFNLANDPKTNLYNWLQNKIDEFINGHVGSHLKRDINFEEILYVISTLTGTTQTGDLGAALGAFVKIIAMPEVLHFRTKKAANRDIIRHLGQHLVDGLLTDFRKRCLDTTTFAAENYFLSRFFAKLDEHFEVSVITTNYDNLITRCLSSAETGFGHDGCFDRNRLTTRSNWPSLIHLHGSVHFGMDIVSGNLHEIIWINDLTKIQNSFGRGTFHTMEGQDYPTSSIIAGYGKTTQLQRSPFRSYYSEIDRLSDSADALIFLGYGFSDPHLNMAFEGFCSKDNRRVVIVDYACNQMMNAQGDDIDAHKPISRALRILKVPPSHMKSFGRNIAENVKELKQKKDFERSTMPYQRLSIWYDGMLSACQNTDKIISELIE